jgi:hypothetical protein
LPATQNAWQFLFLNTASGKRHLRQATDRRGLIYRRSARETAKNESTGVLFIKNRAFKARERRFGIYIGPVCPVRTIKRIDENRPKTGAKNKRGIMSEYTKKIKTGLNYFIFDL